MNAVSISHFHKRAIWWLAGVAVVVLLMMGWIVSRTWLGSQSKAESPEPSSNAETSPSQVEDLHHVAQVSIVEESASDEQVDIFDLLEACPELYGEFSEECLKALDAYFTKKPLVHMALSWVEFPDALTYATIFADPAGDRKRVFAALENPECRLEEGKRIRVDLKETCDAEAFSRFSKFLEICEYGGDPGDSREFYIERDLTRTERLEREWHLEMGWRTARCTKHMAQVLTMRDLQQTEMLKEIGLRFDLDPELDTVIGTASSTRYIGSFRVLRSIAHRLGADETISSTYRPSLATSATDVEWENHVSETRPWLEPWEQLLGNPSRIAAVQLAIDLALSLEDIGAEFDWNYLVERACHKYSSDQTSCQTVLDELKKTTDWTEKRRLQALDEFEVRSLELGLYD